MAAESDGWGAYGFDIVGLDAPERVLIRSGQRWPRLVVERVEADGGHRRPGGVGVGELHCDEERAELWLSDTDSVELDRSTLRVLLKTVRALDDDLVAHPYMALPVGVAS